MKARVLAIPVLLVAAAFPARAADPLELDGVAHVALRVADVPVARAFYQKLGFEQSFEFTDAKGITVSYMKVNDRQFIELYRRNADSEPLGLMHLCFDTQNLDALFAAYVARELKPTDRRKARAGNLLFNLRDPEGQLLEYTQYLPGSNHSNDRGKHLGENRISTQLLGAATAAKDLESTRVFFTTKLGFKPSAGNRLVFPGPSGEEVELAASSPTWRPNLTFAVPDLAVAKKALTNRGLKIKQTKSAVAIEDPDGATIIFRLAGS